jgi:predicted nucleic acid-binding protein
VVVRHPQTPAVAWQQVHLAALAIEHGLTLCSTDGDLAKFPGLKWRNPLGARS